MQLSAKRLKPFVWWRTYHLETSCPNSSGTSQAWYTAKNCKHLHEQDKTNWPKCILHFQNIRCFSFVKSNFSNLWEIYGKCSTTHPPKGKFTNVGLSSPPNYSQNASQPKTSIVLCIFYPFSSLLNKCQYSHRWMSPLSKCRIMKSNKAIWPTFLILVHKS